MTGLLIGIILEYISKHTSTRGNFGHHHDYYYYYYYYYYGLALGIGFWGAQGTKKQQTFSSPFCITTGFNVHV